MSDETWARLNLRVMSQQLTPQEVGELMGGMSSARPGSAWEIDLTEDSGIRLDEQLQIAKGYLRDKVVILEGIPDREVSLSIGWTPRSPQDGILLDVEMVAMLYRVRCYVLLDTYLD